MAGPADGAGTLDDGTRRPSDRIPVAGNGEPGPILVRTRMALEQEQRAALRILEGIEDGTMRATDSLALVEAADPALVYLIITWLRKRYSDHPNADAVLGRVAAISSRGATAKIMKQGQADPIARWFEDSYSYRTLEKQEFIELVIDKLEG